MKKLLWKEWHEQAWKLALGCIVLGAFALIGLRTRIIPDEEMLIWVCFPAIGLLPLLAATGLVPAERGEGTFEALAVLPVPMRTLVVVKTISGLVLTIAPFVVTMGVSLLMAGGREMNDGAMIEFFVRSMLSAIALFFWMFAATLRLPSEARAAMVSIGIVVFWLMATTGLVLASPLLSTISPLSFFTIGLFVHWPYVNAPSLAINIVVEALIVAALWFWAMRSITNHVDPTD